MIDQATGQQTLTLWGEAAGGLEGTLTILQGTMGGGGASLVLTSDGDGNLLRFDLTTTNEWEGSAAIDTAALATGTEGGQFMGEYEFVASGARRTHTHSLDLTDEQNRIAFEDAFATLLTGTAGDPVGARALTTLRERMAEDGLQVRSTPATSTEAEHYSGRDPCAGWRGLTTC